jgi:hypothetical protein
MRECAILGCIEYFGCGCAELVDGLAAGTAGLTGGIVIGDHEDSADSDERTVEGDG